MSDFRVVPARPAHAPDLSRISQSVAYVPGAADANQGYLVFQGTPVEYAIRLAACPHSVVAVRPDDTPVAFLLAMSGVVLSRWTSDDEAGPMQWIHRHTPETYLLVDQIGVAPEARSFGLAQQMLDAVIGAAQPKVVGASIMHSPLQNLRSTRFFTQKNGFSLIGTYPEEEFVWGYYEREY